MKGFVIIDVPECCDKCRLRHMGMAYCNVAGRSTSHTNAGKPLDKTVRPKFCPIIEEKENAEKTVTSFCDAMGWKEERREMKQKEITFEDLVIAAERTTKKGSGDRCREEGHVRDRVGRTGSHQGRGAAGQGEDRSGSADRNDTGQPDRREGRRARQCHATAGAAISHISRPN